LTGFLELLRTGKEKGEGELMGETGGHLFSFDRSKISDQKRLVRGEHLLAARSHLRARDRVHHAKWRVLILAGGSPTGEIKAIRELMPKAHVTAVDKDPVCLEAAIEAGADEIIHCDLTDFHIAPPFIGSKIQRKQVNASLLDCERFDLINIDFCCNALSIPKSFFTLYSRLLTFSGVFLLTFCYGRDVTEYFIDLLKRRDEYNCLSIARMRKAGVPDVTIGRLLHVFYNSQFDSIRSVMLYKGNEMPMCSVLYQGSGKGGLPISFMRIEPGDFELAVAYPSAVNLYDCPQERIDSLRRKFAAIKASLTRSAASGE
jgi:hypothetical protein